MTRKYRVQKSIVGLLLAIAVLLPATSAAAADVSIRDSITLSPTSTRFQADPGETTATKLTVVNDGETDYDFILYARPYSVVDEDYTPDFTKQSSSTDAYTWVQFGQVKYHLNAGASVEVPFTLTVPAKASPGGHYGIIFVETQPKTDGSSIARKKRVGSILYATVSGAYNLKGSVTSTTIAALQFRSPLSAIVTAKNDGNADFIVTTDMRVSDVFGNVKYDITGEYPILPDTTRQIPLEWQNSPWFGLYKVDITTSMLDKQETTVSQYVLIVPRWLLIFVGLFIVGGVGYAILRHRKQ